MPIVHYGKKMIAVPGMLVAYRECWCGTRWICPPLVGEAQWCPMAPAGQGTPVPNNVLVVSVTQPEWAAGTTMPYEIGVQVGSVCTTFAMANSLDRALLLAHGLWKTYAGKAVALRQAW